MRIQFLIFSLIVITLSQACSERSNIIMPGNDTGISVSSSDTGLMSVFKWAVNTSASYVGNPGDPVGPWYEAALPGREAFCIRDVSHQCIAAEILGYSGQNKNMFRKFVENISSSRDYCSFWEINRYNKPAPVDYSSDSDFWYNLNANFDIIDACFKLYKWTGDSTYISDPSFGRFFRLTMNEYISRWQLSPDSIMARPPLMNLRKGTVKYRFARGIPSYDEGQENMCVSGDLLGMIANAASVYSSILKLQGSLREAGHYDELASRYRRLIDSLWWDNSVSAYHGFFMSDRKFYPGGTGQSEFLLWYGVISDPDRIRKSLADLKNSQVEVLSYLPELFSRYGYYTEARDFIEKIYTDKRREYPEASSGVIEGIVRGMAGVEPDAASGIIRTCSRLPDEKGWIQVVNIPVFSGIVAVRHEGINQSTFLLISGKQAVWRAMFRGSYTTITAGGHEYSAVSQTDLQGNVFGYADIPVKQGMQYTATASGKK